MAVNERTTKKKSKASSVHPRKPARTAGPWPFFAGGATTGGTEKSSGIASREALNFSPLCSNYYAVTQNNYDGAVNKACSDVGRRGFLQTHFSDAAWQ